MQNALTYIIVFGFGIALVSIYLYQKDKQRLLPLSKQWYSDLELLISVEKDKGELKNIIVSLKQDTRDNLCTHIGLELINSRREIKYLKLDALIKPQSDNHHAKNNLQTMVLEYTELQKFIENAAFSFKSIRFVAEMKNGKKYKSHELAFNDHWHLFKIDSGKYN